VRAELPETQGGVVAGSVLVSPEYSAEAFAEVFVGYDLRSGEELWREELDTGHQRTQLFGGLGGPEVGLDRVFAEGEPVILYSELPEGSDTEVQRVAVLDPATGSRTKDVALPGDVPIRDLIETETLALAARGSEVYQLAIFSDAVGNRIELAAYELP
jgi:hypothetical protein